MARQSFLASLQGFAIMMSGGTVLVMAFFLYCWKVYDPARSNSFGIERSMVGFIASSYIPVVGATALGFRNVILGTMVGIGTEKKTWIPISSGAGVLYAIAFLGVGFALTVLLLVGRGLDQADAKWLVGIGATSWAATVGVVFDRFFRQYAAVTPTAQPSTTIDKASGEVTGSQSVR